VKIVRVETIRLGEFPNLAFVRLHTDEGLVGLGEGFFGAEAVTSYIHETAARKLLGVDPLRIEGLAQSLIPYVGYQGGGAEVRGNSAIDMALWDIHGKATGLPVYQALGGASRDSIPVYNTCAGYQYIRARIGQDTGNWGLPTEPEGPYEDLEAFLTHPAELAQDLLEQGIGGMKIWPFDPFVEHASGTSIRAEDLDRALEPFRQIRKAVGSRMEILVELHSLWSLPAARQIVHALDEYAPFWYEDPIRSDAVDALASLQSQTPFPVAGGETIAGRRGFLQVLSRGGLGVAIVDIGWCGGLSEARKIGALAESFGVPIAAHDCTGPIGLIASTHLSMHLPNAIRQEFVRASYHSWYRELVTELPPIEGGSIKPPTGAGLGVELVPGIERRPDAEVRETKIP
jgi:galactonate dehydratase